MSIKLMSAIFETEFYDIPLPPEEGEKSRMAKASSVKSVLLALADHANDEGEGAYPGLTRLERKTALSRQGVIDILSAIKYNGLATVSDELSKLGTSNYTINTFAYPKYSGQEGERLLVKPLDYPSQATLPEVVKPLDLNHPLTVSTSIGDKSPEIPLEWQIAAGVKDISIPDEFESKARDSANMIAMGMGTLSVPAYHLAYAFMKARGIIIPEGKVKGNRKAAREMIEMGVQPHHVVQAIEKLSEQGMTFTDLFGVIKTATDLANPSKAAPLTPHLPHVSELNLEVPNAVPNPFPKPDLFRKRSS